jgi:hypothetical protein
VYLLVRVNNGAAAGVKSSLSLGNWHRDAQASSQDRSTNMKLHVRVCSARNLKNKRTLGVQDPYCEIKVGGKKHKTKVHENGDTAPEWDEAFDFSSVDSDDKLTVNVMDEKSFRANCLLGKCRLPVNLFLSGNVMDQWYGLTNEDGDKPAGEIHLRVQLDGAQASAQPEAEPYAKQYSTSSSYEPSSSKTTVVVETTSSPEQANYQQQQPQYSQHPQQYSQPPQGQYAPPPPEYARQPSQPPPGYYAPPPQPGYYAQPPPQQYGHQQYPAYGYPSQGGVAYAAGPPVMVSRGEPSYGHYDHYERRHSGDYGNNGGGGMSTGQLALGVGAGVVGGMLLEDAIEDVFDDDE